MGSLPASAQRMATDNHITYYQRLLQRNPLNPRAYYGLGDALIRKARETGDPSYFNRAEEALKKSLEINPDNAGAMRHLAYVFYSRHEFEPAAVHAGKAIEMDATDGDAYGILGDALMETGEYEKAEDAYGKMMQLEESLYSYSRRAGLKSMRGDSAGAMDDLERAVAAGKAAKQPAESIAWAEWQLGNDQFTLGKLEKAEAFYRQSLATYPNYYRALAGMAQVHAAQKRYDEAIDLYRKAIAHTSNARICCRARRRLQPRLESPTRHANSMSSWNTSGNSARSTRLFTTGSWPIFMPITTSSPRRAWN